MVALGSRPATAPSSESSGPRPLTSRAGPPRLPNAGPDLVATPPSPRPPRIRLRSDTRSPRPTPGHVSRSPVRPLSLWPNKGTPGTPRSPPDPDGVRRTRGPKGGGGGHKAAFVPPRPARCGGRNRPRLPRRPGHTARDSVGTWKPVPPATNRRRRRRLPPHRRPWPARCRRDPPEPRSRVAGSRGRAPNKGGGGDRVCVRVCGDGGGGSRIPSPKSGGSTATHRNMFTH